MAGCPGCTWRHHLISSLINNIPAGGNSATLRTETPTWMHSDRLGEPLSGAQVRRNTRGLPADTKVRKVMVKYVVYFQHLSGNFFFLLLKCIDFTCCWTHAPWLTRGQVKWNIYNLIFKSKLFKVTCFLLSVSFGRHQSSCSPSVLFMKDRLHLRQSVRLFLSKTPLCKVAFWVTSGVLDLSELSI